MRISDWSSDVCSSDLQFTQGAIQSSLNVMDMSIMGEGFIMVKSTSGTTDMSFTRNGSFSVNSERFVVYSGGQALPVYPVNDSGTVISTSIADTRALRLPHTSGHRRAPTGFNLNSEAHHTELQSQIS